MKIAEIWRYPVKSMQGEQLKQAEVGPAGIQGDRQWAVVDAETGVSLSAKRYPQLLTCRASTGENAVTITLPCGRDVSAGSAEAASGLSELLGRQVTTRSAGDNTTIQHEFPTSPTDGEGEPFLYEPGLSAFFDSVPLQMLTTATLKKLTALLPDSTIHPARFRPNFLVECDEIGFIENEWLAKDIVLDSLTCQVYDDTRRCIMVTMSQRELPRDMNVIRTVLKSNEGRAGVALRTKSAAIVRSGATVNVQS